jgi:hypothetical protein
MIDRIGRKVEHFPADPALRMAVRLHPAVIVNLRPCPPESKDPTLFGEDTEIPVYRTETDAGKIESDLIINTVGRRMAAF